MMKKILITFLVKKLLLLLFLLWSNVYGQSVVTTSSFQNLFPDAEKQGACYIFRLDECNIIAVENNYRSTSPEIALIFVQGKQKSKTSEVANRLVKLLKAKCYPVPFSGPDSSVAIFCPVTGLSTNSPLKALLYPTSYSRHTTQFYGWQGNCVKARVDLEKLPTTSSTYSSSSSSTRKKTKGTIEMTINLEEEYITSAEFRAAKGRISSDEIKDFISSRMCVYSSAASMPSLTSKGKKDLRALYNSYDIMAYSSSYDFCIVSKNKTYRAGTLEGVKEAVRGNKNESTAFNFPEVALNWPGEESSSDKADNKSSLATTDSASSSDSLPYFVDTSIPYNQCGIYAKTDEKIVKAEYAASINLDIQKIFPGATKKDACFIFRLDNSRIIVHTSYGPGDEIALIFVTSNKDQKDAIATATRLSKIISPRGRICEVKPFEGNEPSAVIFMPGTGRISQYLYGPMNLLLYPREDCRKSTRFIGWKGGLLVAQVDVDEPGARGVVEVTINPWIDSNYPGVQLRVLSGKVDIQHFLGYGKRMWGYPRKPSKQEEDMIKASISCDRVVAYDPQWIQYCLVYLGKNTFFCGSYKGSNTVSGISQTLKSGFSAPEFPFPEKALPWPNSTTDIVPTAEIQTLNISQAKETIINNSLIQKQESQTSPTLTPAQAYGDYLQNLMKM